MAEKTGSSSADVGHQIIDPTQNVIDLVKAESKHYDDMLRSNITYQNDMRIASVQHQDEMRRKEAQFAEANRSHDAMLQTWMRDSETKRLDQLSAQRQVYEAQIANMLAESVKSTSSLVSTQLVQIQSTFDARVSKLEEFRLLSTGRSSVADPALAANLSSLSNNFKNIQDTFTQVMNDHTEKEMQYMGKLSAGIAALQNTSNLGSGKEIGRHEIIAWIAAALMFVAGIVPTLFLVYHAIAK